jgi:hypothetical protein
MLMQGLRPFEIVSKRKVSMVLIKVYLSRLLLQRNKLLDRALYVALGRH